MTAVQMHLVLNHFPLVGLLFGLVFFVGGLMRSSPPALRTSLRIFTAMGVVSIPVAVSGLVSARVLDGAEWLGAPDLARHRLAGVLSVALLLVLATVSRLGLRMSGGGGAVPSARWKAAIGVLAAAALASVLWTSRLGGELRHTELGENASRGQSGSGDRGTDRE
jgi:hypothetical protein